MIRLTTANTAAITLTAVMALGYSPRASANELEEAIAMVVAMNKAAAKSQTSVDKIDGETDKLVTQYREIQRQIESLRIYNEQVEKLLTTRKDQIDDLQNKTNNAAMMSREVTPLMFRMLDSLEAFIQLDTPFLKQERAERIDGLRKMMDESTLSDSEKFRRILEAYQIENEYGRTIEAYKGKVKIGGETKTVDFLRLGRVVLIYRTIDQSKAGIWDREESKWSDLSKEHHSALQNGFRIARKQTAPDLIVLPVPAAKEVK